MRGAFLRVAFVVACALAGAALAPSSGRSAVAGAVGGGVAALAGLLLELSLRRLPTPRLVGLVAGLAAALALTALARLAAGPAVDALAWPLVLAAMTFAGGSLGACRLTSLGPAEAAAPEPVAPRAVRRTPGKIVDTSVIIDGRIADVVEAGFMDGSIIVPQFVLRELQQVADSSDQLKRNRGRKGLDVLRALQASERITVEFTSEDTSDVREVDGKLLWLAERRAAKVVTNDYNLNKVAQLRGIEVLNVNDLANAVRPVVLPGEALTIQVIKEGKERNQGVGYLDDGTMVVVENGRPLLGQRVVVLVTSVIQTNAGKMIFAAAEDDEVPEVRPRVLRRMSDHDLHDA